MPNHVYNNILVSGTPEQIQAFKEKAQSGDREFSYWNFVTPPQEAIDSGEYWQTNGWQDGERKGNTPNNWYNFNNREWGTKWDTYDIQDTYIPKEQKDTLVGWAFCSAWSPPLPVFEAIAEQFPELEFDFDWEEEQGWGGEAIGAGGMFSITREWDIPESHEDYVNLDREESCNCALEEDSEYWYDDCPRKIELLASNPSEEL